MMNKELEADTNLSHYRIVRKIGAGGMGEVYLAEDTELERQVALKILLAEVADDEDRVRRFVQEAKSASALNHPNILTVYEIGNFDNSPFIATELIKGETLREKLQGERLTLGETLDVAVQIASALNAAHSAGIVHRDIKPENVMLRDDGLVKVLDFGLAKLTEKKTENLDSEGETRPQVKTSPGMVMGTVAYMSPEQARGKEIDARSDIWSLGVVVYEMLTKRTPFADETTNDSIAAILAREPAPLDENTPTELQRIIRKALQKKADERYQTVKDFLLDVKNLKKELEFAQELERSQIPHRAKGSNVSASQPAENATAIVPAAIQTQNSLPQPTSSAEYIVSEVRKHKRGVVLLGSLVLLALIGVGIRFSFNPSAGSKQIESIAVMPFVNESGDADVEYLSDGMTETLISSLANIPNLSVKARSTVFYYKGKETSPRKIGEELNVQAVLLGRVVQRGDDLKLNLELVNTQTQDVIWSEQYNRKQSDLVRLQSEIARDVSSKLKTKLSGTDEAKLTKNYTANAEAYQLYLKGRYYWNKRDAENLRKAIEQFKAAADKDPNYALAYVGLADCYVVMPYYSAMRSSDSLSQAKEYATRAIAIDEQLAEAHTSLAYINQGLWNWAEAEKEYKRAIELNPNYATAQLWYARFQLRVLNRGDEGLARLKRALELEPLSLVINDNLIQIYLAQGDVNSSMEQARRLIELDPNYWGGFYYLGYLHIKKGQNTEALAEAKRGVELSKRSNRSLIALSFALAASGKRSEALAILDELEQKYAKRQADAIEVAGVYAGLGEKDQAFAWLEKAFQDRSSLLVDLRVELPFASLHDDPRFKDLLKRLNLPE